jgi:hypothetical protein
MWCSGSGACSSRAPCRTDGTPIGRRRGASRSDPIDRELRRFFYHYAAHCRIEFTDYEDQHLAVIAPTWTDRAHPTGLYVWVPDPAHPESILRLEPTLAPRGPVLDLWRDEQGRLFYLSFGHRQYVVDADGQFAAR